VSNPNFYSELHLGIQWYLLIFPNAFFRRDQSPIEFLCLPEYLCKAEDTFIATNYKLTIFKNGEKLRCFLKITFTR